MLWWFVLNFDVPEIRLDSWRNNYFFFLKMMMGWIVQGWGLWQSVNWNRTICWAKILVADKFLESCKLIFLFQHTLWWVFGLLRQIKRLFSEWLRLLTITYFVNCYLMLLNRFSGSSCRLIRFRWYVVWEFGMFNSFVGLLQRCARDDSWRKWNFLLFQIFSQWRVYCPM